jgi:hypothetical protein
MLEQRVGHDLDVAIAQPGIPVDARHPRREWASQLDDLHERLQVSRALVTVPTASVTGT